MMNSLKTAILGATLAVVFLSLVTEATYKNNRCYYDNCPSGMSFNWRACSCQSSKPAKLDCPRQACNPGQFFDYSVCQCRCLQSTFCPGGVLQFNSQTCRCECPFGNFLQNQFNCGPGQFFNALRCRCEFLPTLPPQTPAPTPPPPNCPSILSCPFPQSFDTNSCQCVCPASANEVCTRAQILNRRNCQCECPTSGRECNRLQEQNPLTCDCECVQVIPALDDDDSTSTSTGTTRSTTTRTTGTSRTTRRTTRSSTSRSKRDAEFDFNDILVREKRRRSRTRSRTTGTSTSTSTDTSPDTPDTPSPAANCPAGQRLDTRTCRCF